MATLWRKNNAESIWVSNFAHHCWWNMVDDVIFQWWFDVRGCYVFFYQLLSRRVGRYPVPAELLPRTPDGHGALLPAAGGATCADAAARRQPADVSRLRRDVITRWPPPGGGRHESGGLRGGDLRPAQRRGTVHGSGVTDASFTWVLGMFLGLHSNFRITWALWSHQWWQWLPYSGTFELWTWTNTEVRWKELMLKLCCAGILKVRSKATTCATVHKCDLCWPLLGAV